MTKQTDSNKAKKTTETNCQPSNPPSRRHGQRRRAAGAVFQRGSGAIILFALAVFWLAACASRAEESPAEPEAKTETAVAEKTEPPIAAPSPPTAVSAEPPAVYQKNCAECHGAKGEGTKKSPELVGVTTRAEDAYSDEDLLAIIDDAKEFGLSSKMPSFRSKMSEEEKRQIINWLKTLK